MKQKIMLLLLVGALCFTGCSFKIPFNTKAEIEESEEIEESKDDTKKEPKEEPEVKEDEDAKVEEANEDNSLFSGEGTKLSYHVIKFLEEDISDITVASEKIASYEKGDVYKLNIDYKDCAGRYYFGKTDRYDLETFYVTDEAIYLNGSESNSPTEEDFLKDGIAVFTDKSYEEEDDDWILKVHNDGYRCTFKLYSTSENGFYYEYQWSQDKRLTYYRSGYGAEGDPIEFGIKEDYDEVFNKYSEIDLNKDDFKFEYKGNKFDLDSKYKDYVDKLGYPEHFEDNNNGYISSENGYRWALWYPEDSPLDGYDFRAVCVSEGERFFEGDDTYIDFVELETIPTKRGIVVGDSIYKVLEVYGKPSSMDEAVNQPNKNMTYNYEGNKLIFNIDPDNTVRYIEFDYL